MAGQFQLEDGISSRALTGKTITAAANENTVLTAAQLIEGVVTMTPASSGKSITTPTGAEIVAGLGAGVRVGTSFEVTIVNGQSTTHAITFTAGTPGVTLGGVAGMATVAVNTSATYVGVVTAVGTPAVTFYRKGG
jgi:hypothetical protein